jgi:hypothetical protein
VGGFSKIEIAYYLNFMTILRICGVCVNKPLSIEALELELEIFMTLVVVILP